MVYYFWKKVLPLPKKRPLLPYHLPLGAVRAGKEFILMENYEKPQKYPNRLRQCREDAHETLEQVAEVVGVNKSTILRWERGDTTRISRPAVRQLAQHYGVKADWLLTTDEEPEPPQQKPWEVYYPMTEAPLFKWGEPLPSGKVVREDPPEEPPWNADRIWIMVESDSMEPMLKIGDLVLVEPYSAVHTGQYAAVRVDHQEPQICQIIFSPTLLELRSANPNYPTQRFEGADRKRVEIAGLVVESRRRFV